MEPAKKKSFIARNLEWIALVVIVLAGLLVVWKVFWKMP